MLAQGLLFGRYRYEAELGRGASGRVLLVRGEGGEGFAAKVLAGPFSERLRWELDALSRVSHPAVASVRELLRCERAVGPPFRIAAGSSLLIEELAEGLPAGEVFARIPEEEREARLRWLLRLGQRVARGLAAIHEAGFVHGDIKPDNLVVPGVAAEEAKIVDLGLASAPGPGRVIAGTPAYMAPELWLGERSAASDLYALGASLLGLLAGPSPARERESGSDAARPFSGPSPADRLRSLPEERAPSSLRALLASLTEEEPSARLGSARRAAERFALTLEALGLSEGEPGAELGGAPSVEERAMAAAALPLVGREGELAALTEALREPGLVAVVGARGAGRSRLIREATRRLQIDHARRGEEVPLFREAEFFDLRGLFHRTIAHINRPNAEDISEARAVIEALAVEGIGLTVALEVDLEVEEGELGASPPEGARISLGPLPREPFGRLLGSLLEEPGDPEGGERGPREATYEAAYRSTGGLPGRLCRAVAQALREGGDPSRAQIWASLPGEEGGEQGGEGPGSSIGSLPFEARALAEALALLGGRIEASLGERILPRAGALAEATRALLGAGAASHDREGALVLRDDLARALRADLAGSKERSEVARGRLLGVPVPPRARAFLLAGEGGEGAWREAASLFEGELRRLLFEGDPEAAEALGAEALALLGERPGALSSLRLARAEALRALAREEQALLCLGEEPSEEASLLRAELLRLVGRGEEAAALAERLARSSDPSCVARARALLATLRLRAGDLEGARREGRGALEGEDPRALARAWECLAFAHLAEGQSEEARSAAEAGLRAAERGSPALAARARSVKASVALAAGSLGEARRAYGEAFRSADAAGERFAAASDLVNLALIRLDAGELGPALSELREGCRRLAQVGRPTHLARALYNLGSAAFLAGDGLLARGALRRAEALLEKSPDRATAAMCALLHADLMQREGKPKRARAHLREALRGALDPLSRAWLEARLASLWLSLGEAEEARALLASASERADGEDLSPALLAERAMGEARLALADGSPERARREAHRALLMAERAASFEARLRAHLSAAEIEERAGDPQAAGAQLREARLLLDRALATLPASLRARLREVPAYQRALRAHPEAPAAGAEGEAASRERRAGRAALRWASRLCREPEPERLELKILEAALELSEAERAFLIERGEEGELRLRWARDLSGRDLAEGGGFRHRPSFSIAARVLEEGRPLRTLDALHDARLDAFESVHTEALRSVLALPLPLPGSSGGEAEGVLYLDDRLRPGAFDEALAERLEAFSELASAALRMVDGVRRERLALRLEERRRLRLEGRLEEARAALSALRREADGSGEQGPIVARSVAMRDLLRVLERAAASSISVLITGESGTGKELLARSLHMQSPRAERPFVVQNCSAIPETLLESALFGHEKGAFTGADRRRRGLFEIADGGTLFLDEIGEMSGGMQAKLLRVLQEGELRPVGSERSRQVDVRVVAATHRDLAQMMEQGSFREDLYYRIAVLRLDIPPLRDRIEDLPPLLERFLRELAPDRQARVEREAVARLLAYRWPGNIRQLRNEVQRALVLADDRIGLEHLSVALREGEGEGFRPNFVQKNGELSEEDAIPKLREEVDELERRLIRRALALYAGNRTRAAEALGVSRYGLLKMIKRLDLCSD